MHLPEDLFTVLDQHEQAGRHQSVDALIAIGHRRDIAEFEPAVAKALAFRPLACLGDLRRRPVQA